VLVHFAVPLDPSIKLPVTTGTSSGGNGASAFVQSALPLWAEPCFMFAIFYVLSSLLLLLIATVTGLTQAALLENFHGQGMVFVMESLTQFLFLDAGKTFHHPGLFCHR